jgi:ABC-type branched-subunit amino acid transport system substrate-binding protein
MRPRWIFVLVATAACQTLGSSTPLKQANEPPAPLSVLDSPVAFTGPRGPPVDVREVAEVRIGFFAPSDPEHPVGGPAFRGARLAVEVVNRAGGFHGLPLRLVPRWTDDPWRAGAAEMIELVYKDSVWAVLGSVDGSATHVAEQVVTKAWLSLLSPISTDPTLTHIRIPWMFRLPPDDARQGEVIVRDGIMALSLEDVGLVTSTDHDGRTFAGEMATQMRIGGVTPAFHVEVSTSDVDLDRVVRQVLSFEPDGIVVRMPQHETLGLLDRLRGSGFRAPVLLPWVPGVLPGDLRKHYDGRVLSVQPFATGANRAHAAFARTYGERYGAPPTPSAAYAYDAMNLLVRALWQSGLNRSALRDAIAGSDGFEGVTGTISWDNAGGNAGQPMLVAPLPGW